MRVKKQLKKEDATRSRGNRSFVLPWLLLLIGGLLSAGCDNPVTQATTQANSAAAESKKEETANITVQLDTDPLPTATNATPAREPEDPLPSPSQTKDSTFDDLKFEMEKTDPFKRSLLTPEIEQLFGKKIRIRGYIYPTLRKRGLKQFVLVRDNLECCFGPGAALYDCILVRMQPGKTAEYTIRPVAVEGIFQFEEFLGPDGKHLAIFSLAGEAVN